MLNRTININIYGLVNVTDSFSIVNTGTEPASSFDIFYPSELYQNLLTFSAVSNGTPLNSENISEAYTGKRVLFNQAVPPGGSYNFTVTQTFINMITPNTSSLNVNLYRYPLIPYPVSYCTVRILFPEGATPQYPYPEGAIYQNGSLFMRDANVGAFNETVMNVKYYGSLLIFEWHFRYIHVDPWRGIEAIDFYKVKNLGPKSVSKLECKVPPFTIQLLAYDTLNVIGAWPEGDHIALTPRTPLKQNESYIYYVTYKIPMPSYHFSAYDHYVFAFPAAQSYDTVIPTSMTIVSLSVSLTPQATYPPSIPAQTGLLLGRETILIFKPESIPPNSSPLILTYYTAPLLSLYIKPLFFTSILLIVLIFLTAAVRLKVPVKPVSVKVKAEKYTFLEELCSLYEEKYLLILERDELYQKYATGKVKKFEYTKRASDIEKQLSQLEKRINEAKDSLLKIDKSYTNDIEELETAIAQIDQARAATEYIKKRYITGKISKETYEKLLTEQEKKREKSISKTEKKIQELRRKIAL